MLRCPRGAVAVVGEASPRLAVLLPRARRPRRRPRRGDRPPGDRRARAPGSGALRRAAPPWPSLPSGAMVTVDADAGVVYAGRVDGARDDAGRPRRRRRCATRTASCSPRSPTCIVPLTLRTGSPAATRPRSAGRCTTSSASATRRRSRRCSTSATAALRRGEPLRRLVSRVPIDCRLFDLGGGFRGGLPAGDVTIDDVACRPMRALWRGMTDPRLRLADDPPGVADGLRVGAGQLQLRPGLSACAIWASPRTRSSPTTTCNLNSRIGYHFSTVDARIGDLVESNYASFRFVGGSTGVDQRSRRAILIQRLLAAHGLRDRLPGRPRQRPGAPPAAGGDGGGRLTSSGWLLGFVNHLDMALTSDAVGAGLRGGVPGRRLRLQAERAMTMTEARARTAACAGQMLARAARVRPRAARRHGPGRLRRAAHGGRDAHAQRPRGDGQEPAGDGRALPRGEAAPARARRGRAAGRRARPARRCSRRCATRCGASTAPSSTSASSTIDGRHVAYVGPVQPAGPRLLRPALVRAGDGARAATRATSSWGSAASRTW